MMIAFEDFSTASTLASIGIVVLLAYLIMSENSSKQEIYVNDPKSFLNYQPYEPPATLWSDFQVIKAMWFSKITGTDLQERLDSFYETQADLYDSYRFRMLHGRPKMLQGVSRHLTPSKPSDGIVWVDLACGTGANVENFGTSIQEGKISRVYLVDLCRPLCKVARRERGGKYGSDVIKVVHGDVTNFELEGLPPANSVDLVTISYSLVMIPSWEKCIENAKRLLKPGGVIGVTDFTVAPDQSDISKKFWKDTFAKDHVYLNDEHLKTLRKEFEELEAAHGYGTLPYTPFFLKAAYYHFVGKKA